MLWDRCLPHSITKFTYSSENYNISSDPKLTYQKAHTIEKKFVKQDSNNINWLKIKIEEHFKTIHYIYLLLYPKIYYRINIFDIKNKNDLDFFFFFSTWKIKQNGPIAPKIINELPSPTNQLLVTQILSKAKNPKKLPK